MKRTLQPIAHRDSYTQAVAKEIVDWMREAIFAPLLLVLENHDIPAGKAKRTARPNEAVGAIERALQSGQIHYAAGYFTGQFNANISRELRALGARFDVKEKRFALARESLPFAIRGAVDQSIMQSLAAHAEMKAVLGEIEQNVAAVSIGLNLGTAVDSILANLGGQYLQSVRPITAVASVSVEADITATQRRTLNETLTHNLELGIKDFAAERIPELRQLVEKNLLEGGRTTRLADLIESRFGVAKRKAEFLADHETGMLTSKYRQIRYQELGVQEYIWSTSHDKRVRDDHADLDEKRFAFDSPPITNRATGARNNPGEDYRCRCVPKPIVTLPA